MEKTCLELNQNILKIVYLNFLKKDISLKSKALVKENTDAIRHMSILPLYENMNLQKSNDLVNKTKKFIQFLKGSKKMVNDIKNHFLSPFFRVFFKKIYINTIKKFTLFKSILSLIFQSY